MKPSPPADGPPPVSFALAASAARPARRSRHAPDPHDHPDQPLRPPEPEAEQSLWRWLVAAVLVLVIVVGAYQAYEWLVNDVERRRAVAEAPAAPPPPPAARARQPDAAPPVGRTVQPAQPSAPLEAPAPAVTGQAIHKCVVDGQVTYSNQPCPDGAASEALQADGEDPNGVVGSTGDSVPVLVARPTSLGVGDPSHQTAVCGYLLAEITRLDFEFRQPLPPNVLDHISSRLSALRAEHAAAQCAPLPKAAADARPRPPRANARRRRWWTKSRAIEGLASASSFLDSAASFIAVCAM
ncbi:DUF4124 domain-containing protein [Ottowia beijingensis]|uniref:DUF4124 domain-containing protein n=1 Tax=Ottowia beijingensis TaxID=1207057 RepID=A0A853IMW5_9BURK|nr:DUF4124 domain-containing protein [Ottowia beijingensis]NZA01973.1 DUF4124 domain-containing protein [Ottowia beijingensis]